MTLVYQHRIDRIYRLFINQSICVIDEDGLISRSDLSKMFHSSAMLDDDATTKEVVDGFGIRT
jgi:hypothetical protein